MEYINQSKKLSNEVSKILKTFEEQTKLSRIVALLCIEGFREDKVMKMLDNYKKAGVLSYNEKDDTITKF